MRWKGNQVIVVIWKPSEADVSINLKGAALLSVADGQGNDLESTIEFNNIEIIG